MHLDLPTSIEEPTWTGDVVTRTQPKYQQIAADLMRKIETGELGAGTKLPNDLELIEAYGASRNTIRDAVDWLALREFVERRPGQGTFVTRRIKPIVTTLSQDPETGRAGGDASGAYQEYLDTLERRSEEALGTGSEVPHLMAVPRKGTPSVERMPAPDYVADRLLVRPGEHVVRRYQEFWVDQMPWAIQTTFYPLDLVERGAKDLLRAADLDGELAYIAESTGLQRCGYRVRILVRKPSGDEAKFFQLPTDGSVHVASLIRTAYEDQPGRGPYPFRANFTVLPGDRHQFVINSGKFPDEPVNPARDS
jgi:GntR family transcriptional regulator